jgi:class 3 adenylate cyclase
LTCASCGHDNPVGAKFCNDCGARLAAPAPAPAPRSYTPRHLVEKILATKSALEGERKPVTVLFADVARSMELAERLDPEEWHRLLDRLFRILADGVHRYEGTINQYTGDGVMALFGAPIAHEDHAGRACAAALGMARELRVLADDVRRSTGSISPCGWASTRARSSSAGSATTCAWTTPRRATSSDSPPGCSRSRRRAASA